MSGAETVISISGTNTSSLESVAIDLDFPLVAPADGLFPGGQEKGIQLHAGFLGAFERMRGDIEAALAGMTGSRVSVVGHSLGERYSCAASSPPPPPPSDLRPLDGRYMD
jgi:hypothetical protein